MEMTLNKVIESAKEVFDIEAKSILKLKDNIGEEFEKAIEILYNCKGRVIVTGMGKSGLIGKKIAVSYLKNRRRKVDMTKEELDEAIGSIVDLEKLLDNDENKHVLERLKK